MKSKIIKPSKLTERFLEKNFCSKIQVSFFFINTFEGVGWGLLTSDVPPVSCIFVNFVFPFPVLFRCDVVD